MDIDSVSTLDDLLDGIVSDAESTLNGTPPTEKPPVEASPPEQQPPVSEPVSNEAEPAVDVAAEPPVDVSSDPVTPPANESLNWDSDDNPYRKQAAELQRAYDLAKQNVQQQRMREEYAERQRLINDLPNMEPERAREVVLALQAWDRQQANLRIQELNGQTEPLLQELLAWRLGNEHGLTAEERTQIATGKFASPEEAVARANEIVANRKQLEAVKSQYEKQISGLKLAAEARDRMQSPVDRVAVGAGATTAIPSDVNSLDDFLNGLDIPTQRWAR